MKKTCVEPLKGEEKEERLVLDWVSEVVALLGFTKVRLGQKGVVGSSKQREV